LSVGKGGVFGPRGNKRKGEYSRESGGSWSPNLQLVISRDTGPTPDEKEKDWRGGEVNQSDAVGGMGELSSRIRGEVKENKTKKKNLSDRTKKAVPVKTPTGNPRADLPHFEEIPKRRERGKKGPPLGGVKKRGLRLKHPLRQARQETKSNYCLRTRKGKKACCTTPYLHDPGGIQREMRGG